MAYNPITQEEIKSGEPVSNQTQTKIKDNFESLQSRVSSLEGGANTVYPPIILSAHGYYDFMNGRRLLKTTINFNLTLTGVRLLVDVPGTAGTLACDLLYKRGAAAYKSVLSTPPSVPYTAGNDAISSNAVLNPGETNLETGDVIALDLSSVQTNGKNFLIRIDFNKV